MTHLLYAYVNENKHKSLLEDFLPDFPIEFQEKVLRYKRWQDAQLTIVGRLLLKHGLKKFDIKYKENDIIYSEYSKPMFKHDKIKFNISHSGMIVACVITDTNDVGLDIEKIHDIELKDFEAQMLHSEIQKIKNAEDSQIAFFDYWTQKEAVIKANGKGLFIALNTFEIINNKVQISDGVFFLKEIKIDENYRSHLAFKDANFTEEIKPMRMQLFEISN